MITRLIAVAAVFLCTAAPVYAASKLQIVHRIYHFGIHFPVQFGCWLYGFPVMFISRMDTEIDRGLSDLAGSDDTSEGETDGNR